MILQRYEDESLAQESCLGALPDRLADLSRDRPIVTYCRGGVSSAIAASLLRAGGFADVASLRGGLDGSVASGLPVDEPAAAG